MINRESLDFELKSGFQSVRLSRDATVLEFYNWWSFLIDRLAVCLLIIKLDFTAGWCILNYFQSIQKNNDLTIGKTQRLKKGLKIEKWNFEGDVFVFTTTDRQSSSGSLQV